jgi:integrase
MGRGVQVSLRYVNEYKDRHGKTRRYFRRPGYKRLPLPGIPGSPEFMAAYQAALTGAAREPIGAARNSPDSVAGWISLYLSSAAFAALAPATRRTRKNLHKRAAMLQKPHIEKIIASKSSPVVARNFLKALRPWLAWCVSQGLREDDPTLGIKKPAHKTEGYKTWPEEYVEAFRARHPIGTRPRLALELLVNTGAARADVVQLGKQHIRDGVLSFRRHKTGVLVEIPVLDGLRVILDEIAPDEKLTFLLTEQGKPFSDAGFGNWFREVCNGAGVPVGYSAHGVRKYAATLRANLGATAHQLMAWFGWLSIREAERYTRAAERRRLALELGQKVNTEMTNRRRG